MTLPFTDLVSAAVNSPGNYILTLTTDGGTLNLSVFFPFALVYLPPGGGPCPCEADWELFRNQASPNGYQGLTPACIDGDPSGDFMTVQFEDDLGGGAVNYWILFNEWNPATSSGTCEQWLDGPQRTLETRAAFDACAQHLNNNYITLYPVVGSSCPY